MAQSWKKAHFAKMDTFGIFDNPPPPAVNNVPPPAPASTFSTVSGSSDTSWADFGDAFVVEQQAPAPSVSGHDAGALVELEESESEYETGTGSDIFFTLRYHNHETHRRQ
jgi:hypothetical protein